MIKTGLYLFLALMISLSFNGCTSSKIYNVEKNITNTNTNLQKIETSILDAGSSLGWSMKIVKEGKIRGILILRSHMATVNIDYNEKSYKIYYSASKNLQYDEQNNTIHKNYNGWILNLENTINNYLEDLIMTDELTKKLEKVTKDKLSSKYPEQGTRILDINQKITGNTSIEEISNSIIKAGTSLGWKMQIQNQGFILAKIVLRNHSATIKINYNTTMYSINYITSTNLLYQDDYTIHRNYNGWITNLSNAINARMN